MFCRIHVYVYILKVCIITYFDYYQTDKLFFFLTKFQNGAYRFPVYFLALFSNLHFFFANLMWQQIFFQKITNFHLFLELRNTFLMLKCVTILDETATFSLNETGKVFFPLKSLCSKIWGGNIQRSIRS